MTSTPGTGHLHPLVPLAAELQSKGHEVMWATSAESCPQVVRFGFRVEPAGMSIAERSRLFLERASDLPALDVRERRRAHLPIMFGQIAAPRMRGDLVPIVDGYHPDVIIHDLCEFAAAPIAASRGLPHATLAFGGILSPAVLTAAAAGVAELWKEEGLVPSDTAGLYEHLYLHPLPARLGGPLVSPVMRSVRPMHFDGASLSDPPDWITRFGRDRPGLYVTFGTEWSRLAPWTEILAAIESLDVDATVTLGPEFDPNSLVSVPANVRVEKYIPQTFVLDRSAVVVSHAGSGTMFAAAARGIPQLSVPLAADQWDNADALESSGAGRTLELDERNTSSIFDALTRLLDGYTYVDAARALADDFAALPHPREHVPTIEALI